MSGGPLIRYDLLVQDALLGVVRKVLTEAARMGTPGDHHFYVTFRTQAPGVQLSARMKEKYPEEITIVLQHQFWDLSVSETQFEVNLSFSNIPERLVVPFSAVAGFDDPVGAFKVKFEPKPEAETAATQALAPQAVPAEPQTLPKQKPATAKSTPRADKIEKAEKPAAKAATVAPVADDAQQGKVVSIDAFRRKP